MGELKAFRGIAKGLVQGVGYRYFVYQAANRLNICGMVRNLPNGDVEIFAQGEKNHLREFLGELHQGPPFSQVENILIQWENPKPDLTRFKIEHY
ncbi:MAG: acylphosphatase [Calditrichia bacterium]